MSNMNKVAKELKKAITESDDRKPKAYDTEATVTRVDGETLWVKIPGGETETPVRRTIDAKTGDVVMVRVANHRAWTAGNQTSPPTDDTRANAVAIAAKPSIDFVKALENKDVTVRSITAATGYIDDLHSKNITTDNLQATTGYIEDLTSENITAQNIIADHETVESLDANYAHISNGVIDNAKIGYADVNDLNAHYAQIDIANVNNAWIEHGAIKKAEVFDETVFDLSGNRATLSRIDASKINVANLKADNLIVRRINGQPVVGGYTLIDSNSSGYASKNPQALGWYEFVNAQWVLSTDTTVDMTKAYYQTGNEVSLYDQAYIDGLEDDLQQQIDGAVETFTGSVVPTLTNYPYTDWYDTSVTPIHDERAKHVGDIYYVVNSASDENGYCYRFAYDNTSHAYSWVLIKDSDVTKALSDISELQTFESETNSWIDETDEGLETIRTNHTALAGVVDKTVKESVQLWFTKANTTAPNKPTAEVTSTSTAGNAWRKVVPAYNASYPNYYYCWQYKFVDGTFGWSDVVRDIAMGETQGTSRDAKNKADAALPESTFTSFESTTFKDVKDTVTEHSTKFTNMTSRLGLNSDGTGANTDIVAKESALETTVDGISTRVGKTETKLIGMYATSSTAAGTAAKVATITPTLPSGATWELGTGTIITVKFTNANTTSSPTLNVNSKGAKAIKTYANGNLSEAEYKWAAGSTFTFVYNGTNWLMQDSSVSVRMNSNETSISQTADSIISLASNQSTYTKPDGTSATNAIASAITQNADNINLKVSKNDVINQINVSTEGALISANRVAIDGTATFNAIKSSADAAYDSKGSASAVQTNLDNLEIGGRNYYMCYDNPRVTRKSQGTISYTYDAISGTYTITVGATSTSFKQIYTENAVSNINDIKGKVVTLSCEVSSTNSNAVACVYFYAIKSSGTWSSTRLGKSKKSIEFTVPTDIISAGYILRCDQKTAEAVGDIATFKGLKLELGNKATDWSPAPEDVQSEIDMKYTSVNVTSSTADKDLNNYKTTGIYHCSTTMTNAPLTNHGTVIVEWNVGTKYQEYHPDNLTYYYKRTWNNTTSAWNAWSDKIDALAAQATANAAAPKSSAVAEEQYIYISKASGTTSVSGTTTWVTEVGDKQNTWSTKRPTYNSSYPVLFVAKQKKVVSGTVTCTTPVKDDTTTVIDGGHITTGTIDSNRLNADTIKVNAANIQGNLTIGKVDGLQNELNGKQAAGDYATKTQAQGYAASEVNAARSWYATCSTAAGTAAKIATISPATTAFTTSILKAGTLVNVKFTVTNTAAVADLTLNVNSTGAKHIKTLRYGAINNIAGTGYLAANTTYQFTYDGTYWVMQENYNADTVNRTRWQNVIAAAEAITNGHIICGTASGYRDIGANVSFDMAYPLLYAGTAIAKGATTGTRDNNFLQINGVNASSNGTITSGAANKVLYLKGTLTGNTFKIAASPFMTTAVPTTADGACYIPLGIMYSSTNIYFDSTDQLYAYKDGAFGPVSLREASGAAKTATNYITNIDSSGIWVTPSGKKPTNTSTGAGATGTRINGYGMQIFREGTSVAEYGVTSRVGDENTGSITISPNMIIGQGENKKEFFNFSSSGATISTTNNYNNGNIWTTLPTSAGDAYIADAHMASSTSGISIMFYWLPKSQMKETTGYGFTIPAGTATTRSVAYNNITYYAKYNGSNKIQFYSSAVDNTISYTRVKVTFSITESANAPGYSIGSNNTITGGYGFTAGYSNSITNNFGAALNSENSVTGANSIALNHGNIASKPNQTVVGQYSTANNNGLFIIGDGTSNTARSDSFVVHRNGTIYIHIEAVGGRPDTDATSGIDANFYNAMRALGWVNQLITTR